MEEYNGCSVPQYTAYRLLTHQYEGTPLNFNQRIRKVNQLRSFMAETVFSPDGHWMWTGNEWVPAPPSTPVQQNATDNPQVVVQNVVNSEELQLQKKTLTEILQFTEWTSTFFSRDYSNRELKLVFFLMILPIAIGIGIGIYNEADNPAVSINLILGLLGLVSIIFGIKSLREQITFNKENDKKRYSVASGLFGSGIFAPRKSWIHQLDSMITKYEHLTNWVQQNTNAKIRQELVIIEIELTRLIKKRRMSQVITGVAAGALVSAAVKSNWDGKHN
jgi:hypothetical protein